MDIEIKIILDEKQIGLQKLKTDVVLIELRENLKKSHIIEDDYFLFLEENGRPITQKYERRYFVEDILVNGQIKIKSTKESTKQLNEPIKGAEIIPSKEQSEIKYYLYPKIEFTTEEEKNSKVVLLVGKTGDGKSTFVNALVNFYLGINIEDKFRYLLINDNNVDQQKSRTKKVKTYKIRPRNDLNFPPIKIVDTPGFGDTEGRIEDNNHILQFKEAFEKKNFYVNCILYIVNPYETRFGEHQKYVLNSILNLFADDVKENFIVGVSNFIPLGGNEVPNVIKNALSLENSYYYKNILKRDNIPREEILKSDWYIASENYLIFKNKLKRDNSEKETWEKTINNINILIEKIKTFKNKKIIKSKNVIQYRIEVKAEIEGLTEKLKKLYQLNQSIRANNIELNDNIECLERQKTELEAIKKRLKVQILNKDINQIQNKMEENFLIKKQKIINYEELYNIIMSVKNNLTNTIKERDELLNNSTRGTDENNVICKECLSNCHKNCKCIINKYFCSNISITGDCKICKHGLKNHQKCNYIYHFSRGELIEKNQLIGELNDQLREIRNKINDLKNDEKNLISRNENLFKELKEKMVELKELEDNENYDINHLEKIINNLETEKNKFSKKIEDSKIQLKENEIIFLQTLSKIKTNLEYLRNNSLNKELKYTLEEFINERIKEAEQKKEYELKYDLDDLKNKYDQLIKNENINISELTLEKYNDIFK